MLQVIRGRRQRGMTVGQLVNHVVAQTDVGRSETRRALRPLLKRLEKEGQVVIGRGKRYFAVEHTDLVTGRIRVRSGIGILQPEDDRGRPVRIPTSGLRGAMDGDRVVARLERPRKRAREEDLREGTITRILERRRDVVVGRWEVLGGRPHVKPLDRKVGVSIFPTDSQVDGEPEEGELVVVSVDSVSAKVRHGRGRLLERLGMVGEPGVEELAVLRALAIPDEFDPAVEAEAGQVPATISKEPQTGRSYQRSPLKQTIHVRR